MIARRTTFSQEAKKFDVPDGTSRNVHIEVFDSDKLGKDKSLAELNMDISDILLMDGQEGKWLPLTCVKSDQLLLSADFLDSLGRSAGNVLADLRNSDNLDDHDSIYGRKKSADTLGVERDIGQKIKIMNKRGSVDPKNIFGKSSINENLPEGKMVMTLVEAKDLIKSDPIGKSDPYAILTYGSQKHKTPVAKNTQDSVWNHEASFLIPDGSDQTVDIEVFDSDKIGKDESLGKLSLDLANVVAMDGQEGRWLPLAGVKYGQILLMSDFVDKLGKDSRGLPSALANKDSTLDP